MILLMWLPIGILYLGECQAWQRLPRVAWWCWSPWPMVLMLTRSEGSAGRGVIWPQKRQDCIVDRHQITSQSCWPELGLQQIWIQDHVSIFEHYLVKFFWFRTLLNFAVLDFPCWLRKFYNFKTLNLSTCYSTLGSVKARLETLHRGKADPPQEQRSSAACANEVLMVLVLWMVVVIVVWRWCLWWCSCWSSILIKSVNRQFFEWICSEHEKFQDL